MDKKKTVAIILIIVFCITSIGVVSFKFLEGRKISNDSKELDSSIKEDNTIIENNFIAEDNQDIKENESTMQGKSDVKNKDIIDNKISNSNSNQNENTTKKKTEPINNATSKITTKPNDNKEDISSSKNENEVITPSDTNKTESEQNNNTPIETNKPQVIKFYESITHGKKEFATEQEALKRGEEIAYNELNYVMSQNKLNGNNTMKPDIKYFRVYPSIKDENGKTWYYLHFFCESGEGNDDKLKSMY